MNPQIRYGEDLMSRVSYAMLHADGTIAMTKAVRGAVARLVAQLAKTSGVARTDILEVTVVGNPVMHHLFLGLDPIPLGTAPFALATDAAVRVSATRLGLPVNAGARTYVLPCVAGHVGADAAGVMLAETPHTAPDIRLVIDVGTNAEILLGGPGVLLAASSPTGPAFEGAQISSGQRAAPGAIERVRIDRETLEPRFRVIGSETWSDDPGFADATRDSGVSGICGSGIVEVIAELFLAGVITSDGVIDGALADRTARIVPEGRTFAYVLHEGPPRITRHAGGRAGDPAREGRRLCRRAPADGPRRRRDGRRGPARGRLRQPHRPAPRDGARAHPRLRPRPRAGRGQRGRDRRPHLSPVRIGPAGDRGGRATDDEGRDRARATLPGALRGRAGLPEPHGAEPEPRAGRDAAAADGGISAAARASSGSGIGRGPRDDGRAAAPAIRGPGWRARPRASIARSSASRS